MKDLYCEPLATKLEQQRELSRTKGQIAYDCKHCLVVEPEKVRCEQGHALGMSKNGTYFLPAILRGLKLTGCLKCQDFISMR